MQGTTNHSGEYLSKRLRDLAADACDQELTIAGLVEKLEGRVYTLLLALLSLPFCQPIALPGLSTPFGLVIALLGMRFALRQKPWLPAYLLSTPIPSRFLPKILTGSAKLLSWIEKFLHPRGVFVFEFRFTQVAAGVIIFACGLLLLLPLPVPFSNLLPALTVVLVAASISEKDALMLVVGLGVFFLTLGFFGLIFLGGVEVIEWLEAHFSGIFDPNDEPSTLKPVN